ncbi:hypothetical protein BST92_11195 [Nonlabens arenilitoris]|uniref:DUF4252 domain-containing protein n=1 Tax=Nonlabens arenilitoris TaxID=1217969 RepID=A0A2S7UBZ5_9FLAO|nr:DUF4252 domain-containing protein [Nonlabens arenilitoris]PQJ32456.1 hypothetical protein BST92_11195 [Nonlabens arenilitoris]
MKNLIYITAFLLTSGIAMAQNFNALDNLKNTSETVVTDEMFALIAGVDIDSDDKEFNEIKKIIDNLKELRIYATDNPTSAATLNSFAQKYIANNNLVKLMHVKEDGQMFSFHMRKGSNDKKVRDLVMLINGSGDNDDKDTVFLIISGDIDLNQISKLTKMMNVPGQKQIEDATN